MLVFSVRASLTFLDNGIQTKVVSLCNKTSTRNTEVREGRDFLNKMVDLFCDLARPVINILHLNMGTKHSMYI